MDINARMRLPVVSLRFGIFLSGHPDQKKSVKFSVPHVHRLKSES